MIILMIKKCRKLEFKFQKMATDDNQLFEYFVTLWRDEMEKQEGNTLRAVTILFLLVINYYNLKIINKDFGVIFY